MKFTILVASISCVLTSLVSAPSHAIAGLKSVHLQAPVRGFVPVSVPVRNNARFARPSLARDIINQVDVGLTHDIRPLTPKSALVVNQFLSAEDTVLQAAPKKGVIEKAKEIIKKGKEASEDAWRRDRRAKQNARNKAQDVWDKVQEGLKEPQMIPIPVPIPDERPGMVNW